MRMSRTIICVLILALLTGCISLRFGGSDTVVQEREDNQKKGEAK